MKNKILIGAVIVLAAAFIFENAYLLGRRHSREGFRRNIPMRYEALPAKALSANDFSAFRQMNTWDPLEEMNKVQARMAQMFRKSFPEGLNQGHPFGADALVESGISLNVNDTESAYTIKASLPRLEKDKIQVQVKGRQLVISGGQKQVKSKQDKDYYSQSSNYGQFLSSFMLPDDAKIDQIKSDYKNGILTITVPREKAAQSMGEKTIKVPVK
ncbi:MAG: Hsp20/alpha crystallin family protein [Candidatus Omnitrophica bacterium]|nr:Hsp20/alpha crystallin family protein [Candidatus Omnitrophota bacterium]MDD5660633.1 Hsp20/alpha crystallin family protein [Candidatus Omnitrophota bacterium]